MRFHPRVKGRNQCFLFRAWIEPSRMHDPMETRMAQAHASIVCALRAKSSRIETSKRQRYVREDVVERVPLPGQSLGIKRSSAPPLHPLPLRPSRILNECTITNSSLHIDNSSPSEQALPTLRECSVPSPITSPRGRAFRCVEAFRCEWLRCTQTMLRSWILASHRLFVRGHTDPCWNGVYASRTRAGPA